MKFSILLVLLALFSSTVFAAQSEYLHQTYLSPRIQAMGGAFTALADDYNALYMNPAGLARLEEGELNIGLQVAGTPTILDLSKDLSGAGNDPTALQNVLSKHYGNHFGSRVGIGGTWARPSWGIGFQPVDLTIEADVQGSAGTTVGVQAYQDSTLQYGHAWNFGANNSLSVGVAPKAVYRAYFEKDLTIFDLASSSSLFRPSDAQEGLALDFDVGSMYTFEIPEEGWLSFLKYMKPTVALAVRNVIDAGFKTNFKLYSKESSPVTGSRLERRFDVGTRFDLPEFWVFKPRFLADFRDMGTRYASTKKCLHLGLELNWKAFSWLRGNYNMGLSQGYFTAGVGAELSIFRIDVATYSEEIGTASSPRESRRYVARLSLDF